MLDRLFSLLKQFPGVPTEAQSGRDDDPRLAATALMLHLVDADGVRLDVERAALRDAVKRAYGLSGRGLDEFLVRAEEEHRRSIDLFAFTSVLKRHLDGPARIAFIGQLWEIVFADGEISELEDNVVWRVAELIGVDRRDRIAMRQRADPSRRDDSTN